MTRASSSAVPRVARSSPSALGARLSRRQRLGERWERAAEPPLLVASLLYLGAYSGQVLGPAHGRLAVALSATIWITWAMFGVDYLARLALADQRRRWFLQHLVDLAVLVLPFLRPLRLLQLLTALRHLGRSGGTALRGRTTAIAVGASALLLYVGSLAVLSAEQHAPHADITSFGDALWWAVTTITTVGYGDYAPVTLLGRLIAAGLMVSGIAVIGIVTATVASWFVEKAGGAERSAAAAVEHDDLRAEVVALRQQVQQLVERMGSLPPPPQRERADPPQAAPVARARTPRPTEGPAPDRR